MDNSSNNSTEDLFSFHLKTDGALVFNVNGNMNTKQATKELVIASLKLAIQQGYVEKDVKTIQELLYGLISDEEKSKLVSQNKTSGSVSRERIKFDRDRKI